MGVKNQYLKEFIIRDKIFKDDDMFSGRDNNFTFKVIIFLDKYKRVNLSKDTYI